jgi:peptidoglycan/LPS O-acetylase OafA/YrhL
VAGNDRQHGAGRSPDGGDLAPVVQPSSGDRLPGVDGVRAIAAGSVLVYHSWLYGSADLAAPELGPFTIAMPHLALGVLLFFALSGFLLYRPFAAAVVRAVPGPSIAFYLRNRALRILPAYWAILLVTGVLFQAALLRNSSSKLYIGSLLEEPGTLGRNLLLVQSYAPHSLLTGIGPAWSLTIEVAFYLALPVLASLAVVLARPARGRSGRRRAALVPPVVMFLIGVSGKAVGHVLPGSGMSSGWGADWHSVLARSFLANADLFAFGMLLAVIHTDMRDDVLILPRWWRTGALMAAFATAVVAVRITPAGMGLGTPRYDSLAAASCGLLLAIVVLPSPIPPRWRRVLSLLDARPAVAVGLASYSLFLWHEPLVYWLRDHGLTSSGAAGFVVNLALVAIVAGGFAHLSYRWVELPAMSLKRRQARRAWTRHRSAGTSSPGQARRHGREHPGKLPSQPGVQSPVKQPQEAGGDGEPERGGGKDRREAG